MVQIGCCTVTMCPLEQFLVMLIAQFDASFASRFLNRRSTKKDLPGTCTEPMNVEISWCRFEKKGHGLDWVRIHFVQIVRYWVDIIPMLSSFPAIPLFSIWVFPKKVVPPNHPFWGTPIFGNTHMLMPQKTPIASQLSELISICAVAFVWWYNMNIFYLPIAHCIAKTKPRTLTWAKKAMENVQLQHNGMLGAFGGFQ